MNAKIFAIFVMAFAMTIPNVAHSVIKMQALWHGQTDCYDDEGNVISCTESPQQALALLAGVKEDFFNIYEVSDGSYYDAYLGLNWFPLTPECLEKLDWNPTGIPALIGSMSWHEANLTVSMVNTGALDLSLCGFTGNQMLFRLPTVVEAEGLNDYNDSLNRLFSSGVLEGPFASIWSKTEFEANDTAYVGAGGGFRHKDADYSVVLVYGTGEDGRVHPWWSGYYKDTEGLVLQDPESRFVDTGNTIIDRTYGKEYLKDMGCLGSAPWVEAIEVRTKETQERCGVGGVGWRPVTYPEINTLFVHDADCNLFQELFLNTGVNGDGEDTDFWTALTSEGLEDHAYTFRTKCDVKAGLYPKDSFSKGNSFKAWAVRDIPEHQQEFLFGGILVEGGFTSGSWYNFFQNGHGLLIEVLDESVLPGKHALVYWFGHTGPEQAWFNCVGKIEGKFITCTDLTMPLGGRFGSGFDPSEVVRPKTGSLQVAMEDCNSGEFSYSFFPQEELGSWEMPVERITNPEDMDCESAVAGEQGGAKSAKGINQEVPGQGLSGSWFDPTHNGEGWLIEVLSDGLALVYWFTYDSEGKQAWFFNTGSVEEGEGTITITVEDFLITEGDLFGEGYDPDNFITEHWGTAEFIFTDCDSGEMTYESIFPEFGSGSLNLKRITTLKGFECTDF